MDNEIIYLVSDFGVLIRRGDKSEITKFRKGHYRRCDISDEHFNHPYFGYHIGEPPAEESRVYQMPELQSGVPVNRPSIVFGGHKITG